MRTALNGSKFMPRSYEKLPIVHKENIFDTRCASAPNLLVTATYESTVRQLA